MPIATVAPTTVQGARVALAVNNAGNALEISIKKMDISINGKKTEITSSTNYDATLDRVWEDYDPGALGGTFNCEAEVRAATANGMSILPGFKYNFYAYIRRPLPPGDPVGAFWNFVALVEKSDFACDPKTGVIEWKLSTTICGPVVYPVL